MSEPKICYRPPAGWVCTREKGHEGPCAAWPINVRFEDGSYWANVEGMGVFGSGETMYELKQSLVEGLRLLNDHC